MLIAAAPINQKKDVAKFSRRSLLITTQFSATFQLFIRQRKSRHGSRESIPGNARGSGSIGKCARVAICKQTTIQAEDAENTLRGHQMIRCGLQSLTTFHQLKSTNKKTCILKYRFILFNIMGLFVYYFYRVVIMSTVSLSPPPPPPLPLPPDATDEVTLLCMTPTADGDNSGVVTVIVTPPGTGCKAEPGC